MMTDFPPPMYSPEALGASPQIGHTSIVYNGNGFNEMVSFCHGKVLSFEAWCVLHSTCCVPQHLLFHNSF